MAKVINPVRPVRPISPFGPWRRDNFPNPFDDSIELKVVWCLSCKSFHIVIGTLTYDMIAQGSSTLRLWTYCMPNLASWFYQVMGTVNFGQKSPRITIDTIREKQLILRSLSVPDKNIFDLYIQKELTVDEILDDLEIILFTDILGKP